MAHLCGTASIAQLAGATVDETAAALVHAAYDHGDFGDGWPFVSGAKRAEVRAVVGRDAEAIVARYSQWAWRDRLAALRAQGADALADWERPLAFLRLANELEEHVDLGCEYNPAQGARAYPLEDLIVCAQHLDRSALVEVAHAVAAEIDQQHVPTALQRTTDGSALVAPRSTRTRVWVRVTGAHSPLRKGAREVPGARRAVYAWRQWRSPAS